MTNYFSDLAHSLPSGLLLAAYKLQSFDIKIYSIFFVSLGQVRSASKSDVVCSLLN